MEDNSKRVSIARAFVDQPKIVFADEPTGNLDTKTSMEIMDMIVDMVKKHNQTLIIVTHDPETAIYADRIVEISDGKIIDIRINEEVIRREDEKSKKTVSILVLIMIFNYEGVFCV